MATNEERREVARKLRELPTDMYEVEKLWEMKGLDTCCKDQTDYYLIHFALFGCFPVDHMHPCDYEELHMRLADLIKPSIPADPGEAGLASVDGFIREMRHSTKEEQNEYSAMLKKMSVELHPVDRDALLALADKLEMNSEFMEELADMRMSDCDKSWSKTVSKDFADIATCIREALGE